MTRTYDTKREASRAAIAWSFLAGMSLSSTGWVIVAGRGIGWLEFGWVVVFLILWAFAAVCSVRADKEANDE
jgi:hypothetical protein